MDVNDRYEVIIDHIIDIKTEQARQGEKIDQNTDDLKDHIEGVRQNRLRVEILEQDKEKRKGIIKFVGFAVSVLAALTASVTALVKYL